MNPRYAYLFCSMLALLLSLTLTPQVHAQAYPSKPVRLIIAFSQGGPTDILGRLVADALERAWHVSVVPDNRPGAGGDIGTQLCAKSSPDGYTMCVLSIAQAISPSISAKPGFDPVKDFTHVAMLATLPSMLLVHPTLPVRNVTELIALAKAKPGTLNYASSGNGTSSHLMMELFKLDANVNIVHIPFKGTGTALIEQLSGRIEVGFAAIVAALPYVKAGKLRAIAVSTRERLPLMPDVPTIDESGLKGFDNSSWIGIVMPAGVPAAIVNKVNADLLTMLQSPVTQEKIRALGGIPFGRSHDEFKTFVAGEVDRWAKVVRAAAIRGD